MDPSVGAIDCIFQWSDVPKLADKRVAIFHYQLSSMRPFDEGNVYYVLDIATRIIMKHGHDVKGLKLDSVI